MSRLRTSMSWSTISTRRSSGCERPGRVRSARAPSATGATRLRTSLIRTATSSRSPRVYRSSRRGRTGNPLRPFRRCLDRLSGARQRPAGPGLRSSDSAPRARLGDPFRSTLLRPARFDVSAYSVQPARGRHVRSHPGDPHAREPNGRHSRRHGRRRFRASRDLRPRRRRPAVRPLRGDVSRADLGPRALQFLAWLPTRAEQEAQADEFERHWGEAEFMSKALRSINPGLTEAELPGHLRSLRVSVSPGSAAGYIRMNMDVDVCDVLSLVRVPTLVLHRSEEGGWDVRSGRYLAEHINGARFVELSGGDFMPGFGDQDQLFAELERFLADVGQGKTAVEADRVLATVLFTDIVGSSEKA